MTDLITYVPSLTTFRQECRQIALNTEHTLHDTVRLDDDGQVTFKTGKTPVHYSGDESLCVCRLSREVAAKILSITVLGEVINGEYEFDSEEQKAAYERVRGELDFECIDENGEVYTFQLPYKIGVIA